MRVRMRMRRWGGVLLVSFLFSFFLFSFLLFFKWKVKAMLTGFWGGV